MEQCVGCQKEVPISTQTTIHQRLHYVEGAGQLCAQCYTATYVTAVGGRSDEPSHAQYDIYTDDS